MFTDDFLKKTEDTQEFLTDLSKMADEGRQNEETFTKCMEFWAHMCIGESKRREEGDLLSSGTNYTRKFGVSHKKKLNGKLVEDLLRQGDEAMIRLGIENNLYRDEDDDDKWHFADNTKKLRYTNRKQVGSSGSWSQAGINRYIELFDKVGEERNKLKDAEDRCDRWEWDIEEEAEVAEQDKEVPRITTIAIEGEDDEDDDDEDNWDDAGNFSNGGDE